MPGRAAGEAKAGEDDDRPRPSRQEDQAQGLKQQICFDFTKGRCARGGSCRFSHDVAAITDFNSVERGICFDFLRGQCQRGAMCRFSHDLSAITQPCLEGSGEGPGDQQQQVHTCSQEYKPATGAKDRTNAHAMCFDFVKGRCQRGSGCRYSHDLDLIARIAGPGRAQSQICQDHLRGRCNRGQCCRYMHAQLFTPAPELSFAYALAAVGHSGRSCSLGRLATVVNEGKGPVRQSSVPLLPSETREGRRCRTELEPAFDLGHAGWLCCPEAVAGAPDLGSLLSGVDCLGQQQQQQWELYSDASGVQDSQACLVQSISSPGAGRHPAAWPSEGSQAGCSGQVSGLGRAGLLPPALPSKVLAPTAACLHPSLLPLLKEIWNQ